IEVHGTPVDLDHATAFTVDEQPIAQLERLLEEQQKTRNHRTDRILQREADDDRSHAERGEQPADVSAPHESEKQRDADDDDEHARDLDEDRRYPVAPGALPRGIEDGDI